MQIKYNFLMYIFAKEKIKNTTLNLVTFLKDKTEICYEYYVKYIYIMQRLFTWTRNTLMLLKTIWNKILFLLAYLLIFYVTIPNE